jgi:hypothetical protein
VGPAVARNAWPARIARDGTLHVATSDAIWAFELGHRGAEIAARAGVSRVRFAPGPLPRADEERPTRGLPEPTEAQREEAAALAAAIGDEGLRENVQKAVLLSLVRDTRDPPT